MLGSMLCLLFGCSPITTDQVFYRIYKENLDQYIDVPSRNSTQLYEHINISVPTIFLIHGWQENCRNESAIEMISALLSRGGNNVCCIDWGKPAGQNYIASASNTKDVAEILANDIAEMSDLGFEPENVNVFGYSLGAHIAGRAGHNLQTGASLSLGQITALDPAKPLFDPVKCSGCRRLESTDAEKVLVFHTSGGTYGMMGPLGTCDVYPNYGTAIQKGCPVLPNTINPNKFLPTYRCSHERSWKYFGDAIRHPDTHLAVECESAALFESNSCYGSTITIGLDMKEDCFGTYYYTTNSQAPYGRGKRGLVPSVE